MWQFMEKEGCEGVAISKHAMRVVMQRTRAIVDIEGRRGTSQDDSLHVLGGFLEEDKGKKG